jgi:hypothetical protein
MQQLIDRITDRLLRLRRESDDRPDAGDHAKSSKRHRDPVAQYSNRGKFSRRTVSATDWRLRPRKDLSKSAASRPFQVLKDESRRLSPGVIACRLLTKTVGRRLSFGNVDAPLLHPRRGVTT